MLDRSRRLMRRLGRAFWQAIVKLNDDGGLVIASNVALSLLLSLFPFLMLSAELVRFWGDAVTAEQIIDLILGSWPAGSAEPIAKQIRIIINESPGEILSFSTLVALVLATNGVENARDGLNRAYKVAETRSFIWRRVQGAVFVLVGALGLIAAAFILVGAPLVWDFLEHRIEQLHEFAFIFTTIQYVLAVSILFITLYCFHRFLPDTKGTRGRKFWGIGLTIIGIIAGSQLFGWYLQTIANYTALYAGLAGMMIAIVYLYCFSVLILFGAEFNTALVEQRVIENDEPDPPNATEN